MNKKYFFALIVAHLVFSIYSLVFQGLNPQYTDPVELFHAFANRDVAFVFYVIFLSLTAILSLLLVFMNFYFLKDKISSLIKGREYGTYESDNVSLIEILAISIYSLILSPILILLLLKGIAALIIVVLIVLGFISIFKD